MSPFRSARYVQSLTPNALRSHLFQPDAHPLHVGPSLISHWKALEEWSLRDGLQNVRDAIGDEREVDVEIGRKGRGYLDQGYQRVSMGFGLFLDAFILSRIPSASPGGDALPTAYLAQSDILDSTPSLISDIPSLDHYTCGSVGDVFRRTLWIGPKGSWTPFHRDPYIGIYSQIVGTKTFHLLPPSAAPLLQPSPSPRYKNTSTIPISVSTLFRGSGSSHDSSASNTTLPDLDSADLSDLDPVLLDTYRSDLTKAAEMEGAAKVHLGAGESVLVPEGWWHAAQGGEDGPGIGVGAWFR